MTKRRKVTTLDKLKVIVAQAICPLCGCKLLSLDDTHFDHSTALGIGGEDVIENLQAVHEKCHNLKTRGRKSTTYGSDIHAIAKTKRLDGTTPKSRKQKIPARKNPWPKRSKKWGK